MSAVLIRRAGVQDVSLIALISRSTFHDTFHEQNSEEDMELFLENNFNEEAITSELENIANTFLVAYVNEEIAGYAKLSEHTTPKELEGLATLEISRIYVLKSKIGSGVGKALLKEAISIAKNKCKQVIWLGVWEYNETAKAFYHRHSFEKFSEHEFILGTDVQNDWLMKKVL